MMGPDSKGKTKTKTVIFKTKVKTLRLKTKTKPVKSLPGKTRGSAFFLTYFCRAVFTLHYIWLQFLLSSILKPLP